MGSTPDDESPSPPADGRGAGFGELFDMNPRPEPAPDADRNAPSASGTAWEEFRDSLTQLRRTLWAEAMDRRHPEWPPLWLKITVGAVAAGFVIFIVFPLLSWALSGLGAATRSGISWLVGLELAQIPVDAARTWILGHAGDVGVEPELLWHVAIGTAIAFFVLAIFSTSGRFGWVGVGAAAVAMAWAGDGGVLAAGITLFWWAMLSVVALHGIGRHLHAVLDDEDTDKFMRVHRRERRAAADVLDALAASLDELDARGNAQAVREVRAGLLSPRRFPPEPKEYAANNYWYKAVARVRDGHVATIASGRPLRRDGEEGYGD